MIRGCFGERGFTQRDVYTKFVYTTSWNDMQSIADPELGDIEMFVELYAHGDH